MPKWTAGYNLTGYLPDEEAVEQFDTWQEAREYLLGEVDSFWEQDADACIGTTKWRILDADLNNLTPEQVGVCYTRYYSFWIEKATN